MAPLTLEGAGAGSHTAPFGRMRDSKEPDLLATLNERVEWHAARCLPYRRILEALPDVHRPAATLADLPFLPAGLFKLVDLLSVPSEAVVRILSSSGTTGQQVARVHLDDETAMAQARALVAIARSFLGPTRLPTVVLDSRNVLRSGAMSARGAGIAGFCNLGRDLFFALDDQGQIRSAELEAYVARYSGERILVLGLTFVAWQLLGSPDGALAGLQLPDALLVHGGGWKKLQDQAVDNETFKRVLRERCGIAAVHNYYGMVEQTGSVFMECEEGLLHASDYGDILVRDPLSLETLACGEAGLLQVMSILPRSYPGHSLLTEDLGIWIGEDDCACGRAGKTFRVQGRLAASELRGCSDVVPGPAL